MKTMTIITTTFTLFLGSMVLANDVELNADMPYIHANENEIDVMGNGNGNGNGALQIGKKRNENDGVEFSIDDIKSSQSPIKMHKKSKVDLEISLLNRTGENAYLYGWFDFNNDGTFDADELIVDKTVASQKQGKLRVIKINFNPSTIALVSGAPFTAHFELSNIQNLITPQGAGQNNDSIKKNADLMMQADDSHSVETRADESDYEMYDMTLTDEEPVAVTLSSFDAMQTDNGITLEWKVENEMNHAGYNVYRSSNEKSGYEKINESIILGWDGFSEFDGTYEYTDAVNGTYYYKLEAVEMNGSTEMFGPYSVMSTTGVEDKLEMPESFELKQNYPNPFNPSTTISFSLSERTSVNLSIFDLAGRIITTLVDGEMEAGSHSVNWTALDSYGASLTTGVYFYTIKTEDFTATKSMTILK
jgi:hypothetical protein